MSVKLKFHFDPDLLITDGPRIVTGASGLPAVIARLPDNYLDETTTLIANIPGLQSAQQLQTGTTGTLTKAQHDALKAVNDWLQRARDTAKKALPGEDVKLRADFQVGINKPTDLPSVKARALIVQNSCADATNFAALKLRGWTAKDTADFATAIAGLGTTDATQEEAKIDRKGDTGALHTAQNDLFDHLITIQNAGNLELSASDPANAQARAKLLLGTFPPKDTSSKAKPTPAPATATPAAAPATPTTPAK